MRETINAMVILVSLTFTFVAILAGGVAICSYYWERLAYAREKASSNPKPGWQYRSDIELLDRWCCWHFPIIEDVCAWLLNPNRDISQFREMLKEKYGDRERDGELPSAVARK